MKPLLIIFFVIVLGFFGYSQSFEKNKCTAKLEINFLTKELAVKEQGNHKSATDYVNLIIEDSSIWYLGKEFKDESKLKSAILENKKLGRKFVVVIGISNSVPFKGFSDLLCMLDSFLTLSTREVRV